MVLRNHWWKQFPCFGEAIADSLGWCFKDHIVYFSVLTDRCKTIRGNISVLSLTSSPSARKAFHHHCHRWMIPRKPIGGWERTCLLDRVTKMSLYDMRFKPFVWFYAIHQNVWNYGCWFSINDSAVWGMTFIVFRKMRIWFTDDSLYEVKTVFQEIKTVAISNVNIFYSSIVDY